MKYPIGPIKFKGKKAGLSIPNYYTKDNGIDPKLIIHGKVVLHKDYDTEFATIVEHHKDFYIVRFKGEDGHFVQLGFKEEVLEPLVDCETLTSFVKGVWYTSSAWGSNSFAKADSDQSGVIPYFRFSEAIRNGSYNKNSGTWFYKAKTFRKATNEEIREALKQHTDFLLNKAKEKYYPGVEYLPIGVNKEYFDDPSPVLRTPRVIFDESHKVYIDCGAGFIYVDGLWADISKTFVVPPKFVECIHSDSTSRYTKGSLYQIVEKEDNNDRYVTLINNDNEKHRVPYEGNIWSFSRNIVNIPESNPLLKTNNHDNSNQNSQSFSGKSGQTNTGKINKGEACEIQGSNFQISRGTARRGQGLTSPTIEIRFGSNDRNYQKRPR